MIHNYELTEICFVCRQFTYLMNRKVVRQTNSDCRVRTEILSDNSEPKVEVTLGMHASLFYSLLMRSYSRSSDYSARKKSSFWLDKFNIDELLSTKVDQTTEVQKVECQVLYKNDIHFSHANLNLTEVFLSE